MARAPHHRASPDGRSLEPGPPGANPEPPGTNPVLDIGGDVGALVVYLATRPASGELEACPVEDPEARFHTGVHRRLVDRRPTWVALFPEVVAGAYLLLDSQGRPMTHVTVDGGRVEQVDLR